jgi:hypothetical protein
MIEKKFLRNMMKKGKRILPFFLIKNPIMIITIIILFKKKSIHKKMSSQVKILFSILSITYFDHIFNTVK